MATKTKVRKPPSADPNNVIRLKLGTRPKLEQIARENRWKLNEVVDVLADDYIGRKGKPHASLA